MRVVPLLCLTIVAVYGATRFAGAADRGAVARRLALLVVTAWIGEDTMVRAHGFYAYSPHLGPLVDRVPVLVALIWAVVIDSAWGLAELLHPRRVALVAGAIVVADASLIEPVAVAARLWWWTEPGLFGVPPIGILGWGVFTAAAVWVHGRLGARSRSAVAAVLAPPLLTHMILVAAWWAFFRWVDAPISAWVGVAIAWMLLPALAVVLWQRGLRRRVPRAAMLVRVPGALFFYGLLAVFGRHQLALVAYCAAFAWPYLALVDRARPTASELWHP